MNEPQSPAAYFRERLNYDPHTGELTWRLRPAEHFRSDAIAASWNARYAGKPAGALDKQKHAKTRRVVVKVDGKSYLAHRVAWLLFYGTWPRFEVDHGDGDGTNNRIKNLRDVDTNTNRKNLSRFRHNTTGVAGVHRCGKRFGAQIRVDGRAISLGVFWTIDDAAAAVADARQRYGFHENHGREQVSP